MGRVIIKFKDGHLESFKCKSEKRAIEIVRKRPNTKEWNYYDDSQRIPQTKKKVKKTRGLTLEELEILAKQHNLLMM